MDDIPHPFYVHLNFAITSIRNIHWFAPVVVVLIESIYVFYIAPSNGVTETPFGVFLVSFGVTLTLLFLVVYLLIMTRKPHHHEPHATEEEKKEAYDVAIEAEANNWNCYDVDKRVRYCAVCKHYMTRRTYHCKECGVCTEFKDHHCDYFGFCIGKHNLALFYAFFLTLTALCIYGFVCFGHLLSRFEYTGFSPLFALKILGLIYILSALGMGIFLSYYFMKKAFTILAKGCTQFEYMLEGRVSVKLVKLFSFHHLTWWEIINIFFFEFTDLDEQANG
ncbi:palmitoyltransferase ERF2, putative [Entamoeba invadens IP1]|uniref:Palmitoyltransferase n=1 Tax=Entamoeba invadens IP1 TaxID=370355 RepID=A0A0A1TV12_ENTIV|nr:palmitoyltransferase ERF2, putative [Entamoeba invadens IP1]ELP84077.1 palmitoyltransferase ERF2, putative [Entamoeba invadens IP1]|eukprot:XP_004183423.1 palmitoyltransferase ERF2, putative [Entamoeba invadens IP1]